MRRSVNRLGLVPSPQNDETFTSFLLRLAFNHGATAHSFFALEWPSVAFWTRDLDRSVGDAVLQSIGSATGISLDRMKLMTLRGLAPEACEVPRGLRSHALLLPVGVYHRTRRRYGQQFCPMCLAQDPPYLRRSWRLSVAVACPVHHCFLRDSCPSCDAPFIPHKHHALLRRTCHACAANLVGGSLVPVPQDALRLQNLLSNGLEATGGVQGPAPPFERELVDGVLILLRLALRADGGVPGGSRDNVCAWNRLRSLQRSHLMSVATAWVATWPSMWLNWATKRRVTQVRVGEYGPLPGWIARGTSELPFNLGPMGPRPRDRQQSWRSLRRSSSCLAAYRGARANVLLDKVTRLQSRRGNAGS